jgi:hypothetical protein
MKNAHSRTSMQGSSRDRLQCGGLLLELCIEPCADDTEDLRHRVEQWPVGTRKPIATRTGDPMKILMMPVRPHRLEIRK